MDCDDHVYCRWTDFLILSFLLQVNKPPKRNSLTPTIGPEDDQNNSSKLSIHSDGEESNQLNQSQNRPLPDIITNVHSNNGIFHEFSKFYINCHFLHVFYS